MSSFVVPPIQPNEALWLTMNFDAKDALLSGDALQSLNTFKCVRISDAVDVTTTLIITGSPTIIGNKITFMKKKGGGAHGEDYKVTANVHTVAGEDLEMDLIMPIRES